MQADAAQMPSSAQGESGMKVLYQSPDFDKPERDADTVSPSYTESLLNIIEQDDVDLSEETLPPSQKKASPYGFRTEQSATGKSFEEYMKENIFDPSGMTETLYFEAGREIPRMAHGYIPENEAKTEWKEYDYGEESFFGTKADGGIYTSINEFVKWEKALRNNTILADSLQQVAHSAITTVSDFLNKKKINII